MNAVLLMLAAHLAVMSSQFGGEIQVGDDVWTSFKAQNNKQYSSVAEEALRRQVYAYNAHKVHKFNQENPEASFKLGLNHLSDLTQEEMNVRLGYKPFVGSSEEHTSLGHNEIDAMMADPSAPVPKEVDWRKVEGRVGPVKDQGTCGSCWAFATIGVLEGQEKVHGLSNSSDGKLIALSEKELVDCDTVDHACNGGSMINALNFIKKVGGVESSKDYPYLPVKGKCEYKKDKVVMSENGPATLPYGDEEALKKTVATFGPVAVAIHATDLFHAYDSGVLDDNTCISDPIFLNHGVLVVGYGTTEDGDDYWLVKNSWGEQWGEGGYIKMTRNKKNQCGIAIVPTIAKF